MVRRFAKVLFYIALSLYIEWLVTLFAILKYRGWHPELVRFSARVWNAFLFHLGSSGPGFISPIVLAPVTIVLTIVLILVLQGWQAMKERMIETALVGVLVFVVGMLLIYAPQFAWQVAKVTRDEHGAQAETINHLKAKSCPTPLEFVEPDNSLRRRTIALVDELNTFWRNRPVPPGQIGPSNPEWNKYWNDATTDYLNARFRQRLVGIVSQYKSAGVDTGTMEQEFAQPERLVGAIPYGGWSLENCFSFMSELCQLQDLAYRVNDHDQAIILTSKTEQNK